MRPLSLHTVIVLLTVIALIAAGCGGDNPLRPASRATPTPAATPAALPSAAPSVVGPPPTVASSAPVSALQLSATTPTQMPPGGRVSLTLAFTLDGQQPMTVETTVAFRGGSGGLKYGEFKSFNAAPGPNTDRNLSLGFDNTVQVGSSFEVFGVIKAGGQTYQTQSPLVVSVVPTQANVTPVGPSPQPTPVAEPTSTLPLPRPTPSDTRSAQVKAALQSKGFQVLEVGDIPAKDGNAPVLAAIVKADYAQASQQAVLRQAFAVWDVLFHSLAIDSPEAQQTLLVVGEHWTKYVMYLAIKVEEAAAYLKSMQTAGSDVQKQEALEKLLQSIRFRVFDEEQRQFVDQKDFMSKNFTE